MQDNSCYHPQEYNPASQHIQRNTTFLKRGEKSRSHLHTYRVDEQYKTKFFKKVDNIVIDRKAEMP